MTITRNHRHHQHFNDFNGGALAHYKQQTIVVAICDFCLILVHLKFIVMLL
jgi:hypothetical protein